MEDAPHAPFNVHARVGDPHAQNLFVTGSPSQAIREHFRRTRDDLGQRNQMITLLDLARGRAAPLLKALSEATGAPVERLHLRDQATLKTLATIERTTVRRRDRDTLKVYFADTRDAGSEEAEVCAALMERSQLTAVLLDGVPLEAAHRAIDELLSATRHSTWRCPLIAFLLPPTAAAQAAHIRALPWPAHLRVDLVAEPLRGASALWNTLLSLWEQRRDEPLPMGHGRGMGAEGLDPKITARLLAQLLHGEGVHGCALVDGAAGTLLAGEVSLPPGLAPDLQRAALATSLALRAQQHAARTMGWPPVEEYTLSAGDHQHIVRSIAARPGLFLLALLDRKRANVALARFKLREAERSLG